MARNIVVTGSASGIGAATCRRFEKDGANVIGVDLRDAAVIADLTTADGRRNMIESVGRLAEGRVDVVIANAGGAQIELNYFGAVATLEGLRPMLERSEAPRAVATGSYAMVFPVDDATVDACLAGDEVAAVAAASRTPGPMPYASAKRALARWVRRRAPTLDWAGAGIALNAIAPSVIVTPMTRPVLDLKGGTDFMMRRMPMPLGGPGAPEDVAALLGWLTSPENTRVTGQVIFIDGGTHAVVCGDDIWRSVESAIVDLAELLG